MCPLCGKSISLNFFDPSNFEEDILLVRYRGLGRGKGFEEVERYSLLDGGDPELLDLISDRVAILYDLLYEDVEEESEEDVDLDEEEYLSDLDKDIIE